MAMSYQVEFEPEAIDDLDLIISTQIELAARVDDSVPQMVC